MTDLEWTYGLTPADVDRNGSYGIVMALKKIIALFNLLLDPGYPVSDNLSAASESNFSNNAMVTEWQ
jgi:hypothetical protein